MPAVKHYKKVYERTRAVVWGSRLAKTTFFAFAVGSAAAALLFIYYAKDLPRPEALTDRTVEGTTKIYDKTGTVLLYELSGDEKREVVPLGDIALSLQQAVIATEDAEFSSHLGISPRGLARAILTNLGLLHRQTRFATAQGGSTISQQLIRSSLLTNERSIERKIREIILTLELERRYSKDEILEFYLNQIPLGATVYGVGTASQLYFHKPPSELTLEEAAALAAMIQAPSYFSPYGSQLDELLGRKDYVLERMAQEGFISAEEAQEAQEKPITFERAAPIIKAPHFVFHVLDILGSRYGDDFLRENGLSVYTTLDWELQSAAEKLVGEYAARNAPHRALNAALVALDPRSGEVLAMVGSKDWFGESYPEGCTPGVNCLFDPQVNVATVAQGRQPGSAFKPFVYATAFAKGYTDETVVIDEETNFGVWGGKEYIPQNYDETYHGEVSLREALAQSMNIPAVKVLVEFSGIEDSLSTAREMGITTLRDASFYGPSLVLGGGEVRLLDIVSAYGVFAREGRRVPPSSIARVEDSFGRIIEETSNTPIQVISPAVARMITSILSDNEARAPLYGLFSPLHFPERNDVAAKTGTTQEYKDAWTIGYTPNLVVGVWAGNNDSSPTDRQPGAALASPLWHAFTEVALEHTTETPSLASPSQ